MFEWSELTAVTDLASAKAAIELIVEQGEGARGHWRDAHFGKLLALLEDYLATRAADPGFEPARPVEPAYVRRPPRRQGGDADDYRSADRAGRRPVQRQAPDELGDASAGQPPHHPAGRAGPAPGC